MRTFNTVADLAACVGQELTSDWISITQQQINHFCDSLRLFKIGYSWAGPISLCVPYHIPSIRSMPWQHKGGLVRFAAGLEAVADLKADISQAMAGL